MYAIVRTGGKQYRVNERQILRVGKIEAGVGAEVRLEDVLLVGGDGEPNVGAPTVAGAVVRAEVVSHGRGRKIRGFTFKAKKNERKRFGHRQDYTELRVQSIEIGTEKKRTRSRAKPAAESAEEPSTDAVLTSPADAGESGVVHES